MNNLNNRRDKLLSEKPSTLFFELSVPGIIGMLVFGFYQFIDGIFVGQFVGAAGLGAVGLVYPFTLLNNGISGLIGTGAASLVSRGIGNSEDVILKKIFPVVLFLNLIINALITIISIIFAPRFISFMGGQGEMLELGVQYMRIIMSGTFFINFAASSNMLIRSEGLIKDAMIILGTGALLNLVLDPLFILVLNLGIRGAAAATVVSQIVSMILSLAFLHSKRSMVIAGFKYVKIDLQVTVSVMKIGFSALALPVMAIVQIVTAYKMLDLYAGINDVIALGTIFKIFSLFLPPVWGIAQGMQPFIGINYGAGKLKRMIRGYKIFTGYATIFNLIFWSVLTFAPVTVTGWFIVDQAIQTEIYNAPRIFFIMYPLYGFMFNTLILLQATGKSKMASIFVTCRMLIFFIPPMLLICPFFGAIGVWLANPISDILTSLTAVVAIARFMKSLRLDPEYV